MAFCNSKLYESYFCVNEAEKLSWRGTSPWAMCQGARRRAFVALGPCSLPRELIARAPAWWERIKLALYHHCLVVGMLYDWTLNLVAANQAGPLAETH